MSSAHLSDLSFSCLQRILRNEPLILLWKNQHKYYTNVDVVKTSVDRMRKIAITALNLIKRISTSLSHRFYHTTLTSFPSTITSGAQIAGFCIEQICFLPSEREIRGKKWEATYGISLLILIGHCYGIHVYFAD